MEAQNCTVVTALNIVKYSCLQNQIVHMDFTCEIKERSKCKGWEASRRNKMSEKDQDSITILIDVFR